jgi:hypothetical protein
MSSFSSSFVAAIEKRVALESANGISASSIKLLNDAKQIIASEKVSALLESIGFDATIPMRKANEKKLFDVKALKEIANVALFLSQSSHLAKLNPNQYVTLKTLCNFSEANMTLDSDVIAAALNNTFKHKDKNKQKLIFARKDAYSSDNRQTTMMMHVLRELRMISATSPNEYKVNDNEQVKRAKELLSA